jgi:hypothetical protein
MDDAQVVVDDQNDRPVRPLGSREALGALRNSWALVRR